MNQPTQDTLPDTRPYLCIPYWTTPLVPGGHWDTGQQRPLPKGVVYYLCDSIQASAYTPGEDLHVSVRVRNSAGTSTSIATVVVYWAKPTAGFATLNFFGATTVPAIPERITAGSAQSSTMTARIPADAPQHICLLAVVSHPRDRAGTVYDPVGDRHWAQRNLTSVAVAPGAPAILPFQLANPFPRAAELILGLAPADRARAATVAASLGREPAIPRATLRLLDENGGQIGEPGEAVVERFGLDGHGELGLQVMVELAGELPPGTAGTVEALVRDSQDEGRIVGALGIALLPTE